MNFVKRAGFSLLARKGKTGILLGVFLVLCTLLLGGFLLQGATARQEAAAQRRIGVDVTVRSPVLTSRLADRIGSAPPVLRYNPVLRGLSSPRGAVPVASTLPKPRAPGDGGGQGSDALSVDGVRDSGMLLDFAVGNTAVVSGRGITAQDAHRKVALVEQRFAAANRLKVGDPVVLTSPDGRRSDSFRIVGLYQDSRPDPPQWTAPSGLAANQVYVPVAALSALGFGDRPEEAVFRIGSPAQARRLHAEAARLLGSSDGFRFDVNDKAYRDQVVPLQQVGAFVAVLVRLIALSGAVVLGLIVAMAIRERRAELGMLLALGEKKWKLIGQHTVEVTAVLLPALALAALAGQSLAQQAGTALLAHAQHSAGSGQVLAAPQVRMGAGDLGRVAGIGLGISLVSTVLPGIGILRLHPRSILTDTE
ncbi:ABC transporter permease [Streptacidiphilus cavernicola]|uniref:ABC transporter permease n=1 Tax=Streptacidiphilus cavernicola TaxID=3342716 RepID=A0ABV6W4S7_9ACTN